MCKEHLSGEMSKKRRETKEGGLKETNAKCGFSSILPSGSDPTDEGCGPCSGPAPLRREGVGPMYSYITYHYPWTTLGG